MNGPPMLIRRAVRSLADIPSVARYLGRIGAEPRNLTTAVVREHIGHYPRDIATINITSSGAVTAPEAYAPTDDEQTLIAAECPTFVWPQPKKLAKVFDLPQVLVGVERNAIFEFRDQQGMLTMLQHRVDKDGKKFFVPYTFYDDGEWRSQEPDGKLPLWGLEHLKDNATVFLHEGAGAARFVHRLINPSTDTEKSALRDHPWRDELQNAAHLGWPGGAFAADRVDWSPLRRSGIKRVYIVADNDKDGKAAVPKVAKHLTGVTVFSVQFNSDFPTGFDLGDRWPEELFKKVGDHRYYAGPAFRDLLNPATYATSLRPNPEGKGRPVAVLRDEFRDQWAWVEESDLFVNLEMPGTLRDPKTFNGMMGAFSDTANTAALLQQTYSGRHVRLAYRPDKPERFVHDGVAAAINVFAPSTIKSVKGDIAFFEEFMANLIPDEEERKQVMRWCATLVGRPGNRMHFGLLLISEMQGVGKTFLAENILAPAVGLHNCSFPAETEIVDSKFNSWIAHHRLVVVGEIYQGNSWKAANRLKSVITDRTVDVNQKFQRPYTIENWAHIVACSNSLRALKLEESDRRWFVPTVTEKRWPRAKFADVAHRLEADGLSVIKYWAEHFDDYVTTGEGPPTSLRKRDMITESLSDEERWAFEVCCLKVQEEASFAVSSESLLDKAKQKFGGPNLKIHTRAREMAKQIIAAGLLRVDAKNGELMRVKVGEVGMTFFVTPRLAEEYAQKQMSDEEIRADLRGRKDWQILE